MQNPRIIRKYPNRRLYDTDKSCYITLEDLKNYVIESIPFKVIDAKTGEEMTRAALFQIILELEGGAGVSIFSQEVLEHMVRFYGHPLQHTFQEYLQNTLALFMAQSQELPNAKGSESEHSFITSLQALTHKNLAYWTNWWADQQRNIQKDTD